MGEKIIFTLKKLYISPLKLVIWALEVGKNDQTGLELFDPWYTSLCIDHENLFVYQLGSGTYQVCPSIETPVATGFAVPSAFQLYEMGPAFMLASQIMISFALEPPTEVEVNRSYAMSATTFPVVVCFHDQADYID